MRIESIPIAGFKLDGGAMFGVVPKRMWNKLNPADDENMCTWQMRCLYIEDGNRKIIIDTGIGQKQDEKFRSHFYPHDEWLWADALAAKNIDIDEITDVFLTHLHFDHVGGALSLDDKGNTIPTFPNAVYWTNEAHFKWAMEPNPREAASFLKENIAPLKDLGLIQFLDIEQGIRFSDNITVDFVYGHTEAMMLPNIHLSSGNTLIYCADLIPSHYHIPLPYIMAYDLRPLDSLSEKVKLHEKALQDNHYLFFEHDPTVACGTLTKNAAGRTVFDREVALKDIV